MAGKCLWIALFVTLQISFVLCRSTGQPDEAGKEFTVLPTGEVPKAEALKDNAAPGEVIKDGVPVHATISYMDVTYPSSLDDMVTAYNTAVIVVVVLYFVFLFGSLILGCILYYRAKARAVRPGRIVGSTTGMQSFGIK